MGKLDRRAERGEKTVKEAWQEVKKAARKLEVWIEEIAEQKGDFEYEHINKCEDEEYNKARKRLRRKHKREVVREIEKLSTRYPGEYWRLLKQLSGRKKKKTKPMKTMVDEEGYEVEGEEIQRVWKEAFEKLGKKGGQETFDENFTKSVENEVEEYKKILRKRYNNCKNVLNKARKKLRRIHKREVVREIEKLSTRYPGEYWRLLKQLTGR